MFHIINSVKENAPHKIQCDDYEYDEGRSDCDHGIHPETCFIII